MKRRIDDGENDSFFRSMFAAAPVGVSLASFDGSFMQVNPALCKMLGYSEDELNQLGLLAVSHPDDLALEMRLLDEMRESVRDSYQVEKRCVRSDGSILHTRLTVALVRTPEGEAIGGIGFLEDIEHQHHALQMLRESESRFRSLVQNSSDAVLVANEERFITYASHSSETVLGWPSEELLGWWVNDLFGLDYEGNQIDAFEKTDLDGIGQIRHLVIGQDGEQRWIEASITDRRSDPAVTGYVINCRDVSEHVYAYETLLESQERYRTVVDAVHEVVFQADINGCWTFLNPAFEVHTGFKVADALGVNFLEMVHPDDRPANFQVIQAMRQGLITEGQLEGRYQSKEGSVGLFLGRVRVTRDPGGSIVGFAGVIRDVTQAKEHEVQLSNLSFRDPLTGLANRSLLLDRLEQSQLRTRRSMTNIAVIHLGLDDFTRLNDRFGNLAGNTVLASVAGRLVGVLRGSETVARVGGDQFAVVSEGVENIDTAEALARRILQALSDPFMLEGSAKSITFGIGIVLENPETGRSANEVLRDAALAMARAKARGANQIEVLERREPLVDADKTSALANEISPAISSGDIVLHYQPVINLNTNLIVGFEALLRWQHPTRGLISPMTLVSIAEEAELDDVLAKWVIQQSLADFGTLQAISPNPISMNINLSARQIANPEVVSHVNDSLKTTGSPPGQFIIDLTERSVVEEEIGLEGMGRLRDLGVAMSLDDYGSGLSSLLFLRHLPIDMVKVDPSFVTGVGTDSRDQALISGVVAMAAGLGLTTVAEGVESHEQASMLKDLGCNQAQGHFFGHPTSLAGARERLLIDNR